MSYRSFLVNRLLAHENRVAMTNRPTHGPTPESNEVLYRFFEHFLKPGGVAVFHHRALILYRSRVAT